MILATFVNSHFSVKTQITNSMCSKLLLHFDFENHSNMSMDWLEYWWHSFLQHSLHNTVKVYPQFYTYYLPTSWGTFAHLGKTLYIRRCLQVQNFHHWQRRDVLKWVSPLSVLKVFCKIIQNLLFWHEKRRPVSYNRTCRIQTLNAMDSQCPWLLIFHSLSPGNTNPKDQVVMCCKIRADLIFHNLLRECDA